MNKHQLIREQHVGTRSPILTLDCVNHVGLQRGGEDRTGQVLQEPDHPVTQGRHLQLLQVCKQTHLS